MTDKINVIIKEETLGMDIGSLLNNPLVSTGMNAVLPGSGFAMPFVSSLLSPQKPSGNRQPSQAVKRPTIAPPPRPMAQPTKARSMPAPPPPQRRDIQSSSLMDEMKNFVNSSKQTQTPQKEGIDKNLLLFGGIALAGVTVLVLTNQKRGRK
jgi:hypothetical protein